MGPSNAELRHTTFPKSMVFQKTWRTYQARLLGRLDSFLGDQRLHIIAAPGSGKTVLGIEVVRRIDRPTLVLAPTITIRNQWADRLVDHFLAAGEPCPPWLSTDLKHPTPLTIATYQALHSLCSGELDKESEQINEEEESGNRSPDKVNSDVNGSRRAGNVAQLPEVLKNAGFRTLVVDEAHHLRAEWWKTLTFVVEHLNNPTIVALTATPPYDVSPFEWQRYEELCGPVDAEVSVPELVRQGDLCPHQDYVYFSTPAEKEQKALSAFRAAVEIFVQRLRANGAFAAALTAHRWMRNPHSHVEEILEDPQYLSSMVVYVNAVGVEVNSDVLNILGLPNKRIPFLDLSWLETLLSRCLYSDADNLAGNEALFKSLRRELLEIGAIEHRRVKLQSPADHTKLLTSSVTKLKSIEEIVRLESGAQGCDLRCVILTDFIRKAEMPRNARDICTFEDIGIVPIFESLRRADLASTQLGVLSGSLVVIPATAEKFLREAATTSGVRFDDLFITKLEHDASYLRVELRGEYHQGMVRLITHVFERGGISVLVGTKSLLGEGWDAPCINTLVLASFVGSYVLSNQMRGRSIRVDPKHPGKTANIWHLVCVEPGDFGPGGDYELLVRRCSAFVGVSATASMIENGTERLGFGHPPFRRGQIVQINSQTCNRALDRAGLRQQWQEALGSGTNKEMVEGLKADAEALPGGFVLTNTIASLLVQAGFIFLVLFSELQRRPIRLRAIPDFFTYVEVAAAFAAAVSLPWALLALWRFIRHGTPERSVRQIGSAVLRSLEYEGSIDRRGGEFRVYSNRNDDGTVFCWVGGGTGKEQAIFLRALREILRPIESPRYLLARRKIWRIFREDYFAVPDALARKKEFAEVFASQWRKLVGPVQLIYTRTPEGRRLLLRARVHSLAGAFQKRSEHVSCWK
jgi:superfamily II DNA or RNA helicase